MWAAEVHSRVVQGVAAATAVRHPRVRPLQEKHAGSLGAMLGGISILATRSFSTQDRATALQDEIRVQQLRTRVLPTTFTAGVAWRAGALTFSSNSRTVSGSLWKQAYIRGVWPARRKRVQREARSTKALLRASCSHRAMLGCPAQLVRPHTLAVDCVCQDLHGQAREHEGLDCKGRGLRVICGCAPLRMCCRRQAVAKA
jgi:hypothetical protein